MAIRGCFIAIFAIKGRRMDERVGREVGEVL
jgi:hypothetical protein